MEIFANLETSISKPQSKHSTMFVSRFSDASVVDLAILQFCGQLTNILKISQEMIIFFFVIVIFNQSNLILIQVVLSDCLFHVRRKLFYVLCNLSSSSKVFFANNVCNVIWSFYYIIFNTKLNQLFFGI